MAKASGSTYQDEYLQIIRDLDGDRAGRSVANEHLFDVYERRAGSIDWATNPYVIDGTQYDALDKAATTMVKIMEKVMFKYHRDRSFRSLFSLDPKVEELTLVPSGFRSAVPLMRLDIFFDPATCDFKIGGIVTGGMGGMAANAGVTRALYNTESFHRFKRKHPGLETTDALRECINTILYTYSQWTNAEEGRNHPTHPSLAIVDIEGSVRAGETRLAIDVLRELGVYARASHFSQLRIETIGGIRQLVDNHGPITCVWLRATADEAAAHPCEGLDALVKATRRGMVCTIGGYRSWPCCTRSFVEMLRSKDCRALLTKEENDFIAEHLPEVHLINASSDLSDFYDQDRWVIKTTDGPVHGNVLAGNSMSKQEWRTRLVKSIKRHDAVQDCIAHPTMLVAHADDQGNPVETTKDVILRLYVFGGALKGIAAGCGTGATVPGWNDYLEMACVIVRD